MAQKPPHMREEPPQEVPYRSDEEKSSSSRDEPDLSQINPNLDYKEYKASGRGLASSAQVTSDGRIVVSLDLKKHLPDLPADHANEVHEFAVDEESVSSVPPLNVVIMIVGSRGDVQPYVALGIKLAEYGHRVRIATHETFRSLVKEAKLGFHNIGGNPQQLMSYMVRNPGLIPGFESLTNGDIKKKRRMLAEGS